jgi:biotin synthase
MHAGYEAEDLIGRARELERAAMCRLLNAHGELQEHLFSQARSVRNAVFGSNAIVRGLIEITNACRQSCLYCPMRIENRIQRFHLDEEVILASVGAIHDCGIRVVFLQGGEVPGTTRTVGTILPKIRTAYDDAVEILLCLGNKPRDDLASLRDCGADSYILKQETSDPDLHWLLRQSSLDERLLCVADLQELGYRIGLGSIVGLPGQTVDSLVNDLLLSARLGADMVSASPFVPALETPLAREVPGDIELTLNMIALLRIIQPNALIPSVSALEQQFGAGGQRRGFDAGANVITVNFTPPENRENYTIYGHDRFVVRFEHAMATLAEAGLVPQLKRVAFGMQPCQSSS